VTLNKLDLDVVILTGRMVVEEPVITFIRTPNARQGDIRHPEDAARLIRKQFKTKTGTQAQIADAWFAKNFKPSLLPTITHVSLSESDEERLAEVNSDEFRARLIADAAVQGVRLGFGKLGEDGYELSAEQWVTADASGADSQAAYRAEIRRHLSEA